jgi:acyl-CoA thioesterase FadM
MGEEPEFDKRALVEGRALFTERRVIRLQEVDAAQVLFFARYLDLCHDAWDRCLAQVGVSLPRAVDDKSWGMPLVHVESEYLQAVRFGDELEIAVVRARWRTVGRGDRLRVGYRISRTASWDGRALPPAGEPVAVARLEHAFVAGTPWRGAPAEESVRRALQPLVDGVALAAR